MKLKKTKKDIIEAIKTKKKALKTEMFEIDAKVQAVAPPSFVNALVMSAKNKQMVIDRMKEKEKEKKELMAQTVDRKANATPKTDAMKKMKLVEQFVNESFKGKSTLKENVLSVLTPSRADLTKLIKNARENEVKYTISRLAEGYQFNYQFEVLTEDLAYSQIFEINNWAQEKIDELGIKACIDNQDIINEFEKEAKKAGYKGQDLEDAIMAVQIYIQSEYEKSLGEAKKPVSWFSIQGKKDKFANEAPYGDDEDEELERLQHLKDLYDIEPGDLTDEELEELRDAGMLEESKKLKEEKDEDSPYKDVDNQKLGTLGRVLLLKDLLDVMWNSVRLTGKDIKGQAVLYKTSDGEYKLDTQKHSFGQEILKMKVKTEDEHTEDADGYPIIKATLTDEPLTEGKKPVMEKMGVEVYSYVGKDKLSTLDRVMVLKDLLDVMWNAVYLSGKGIDGTAILYADLDGGYELALDEHSFGENILNMKVKTNDSYDNEEDDDELPIIYAELTDEPLTEGKKIKEDANSSLGRRTGVITVAEYKGFLNDALEVVAYADDKEKIRLASNTYKLEVPFIGTYGGYIAINSPISEDQSEDEMEEGKKEMKMQKPLKESALSKSKFRNIIGEYFNYSSDFDFLDVVAQVLDRVDFEGDKELIAGGEHADEVLTQAIDDALTYTQDQWFIAEHYASTPADLDWQEVVQEFSDDMYAIFKLVNDSIK
jgi:hypothetical protein